VSIVDFGAKRIRSQFKVQDLITSLQEEQDEIIANFELIDAKHDLAASKGSALQDLFRTLLRELMTAKTSVYKLEMTA
jgi:hypothetical protein